MRRLLVMCALLALVAQAGVAAIPETMSYQGVLTDAVGSPVPDGFYNLTFRIYAVPVAGVSLWTETQNVFVEDGIFDVILGDVNPIALLFDTQYYLATQVGAAPELTPRTKLTAASYAFRAKYADTGAPDADWVISGDDIYHIPGSVAIGDVPRANESVVREGDDGETHDRGLNKLYLLGENQRVLYSRLVDTDDLGDERAAIYGYRTRTVASPGDGYGHYDTNTAVTGYNFYGDPYTFGVAGYSWFDYERTGGVLGSNHDGTVWASLGYQDENFDDWGVYTPDATYLGGPLQIPTGATNGYVLTSDASGNATWQAGAGGGFTLPYAGSGSSAGPLFELEQNGAGETALFLDDSSWEDIVGVGMTGTTNKLWLSSGFGWASISGGTTNTDDIVIQHSSGEVGIGGVTSPSNALDVGGTVEMLGFQMATGAGAGYVLTSSASGVGTWQASTGGVGGGGSANYIPRFTAATTLGNSVLYQDAGGDIGIGTTSPASTFTVNENTSGQALEVNSTYVGSAGRLVDFSRTSAPSNGNDMLQIVVPSSAPDGFQFIECERSGVEFVVDGDGQVTTQGGVVSYGPVSVSSTLGVTTTTPGCASFQTNYGSSTARPVYAEYTGTGSTDAVAIEGRSEPTDFYGIGGRFYGGFHGVEGRVAPTGSSNYYGVYGYVYGATGSNYGVYGYASGGTTNWAGYFSGNVNVSGTLSKGGGSFVIDHPLDPANKVLRHSFVESPDMMNIYNGNAVLDASGRAWVEMPEWFDELNVDFRYQLTSIGAPGPNLYVATEMTGIRFEIAGGEAGMKVSWQVTGIRNDAFARANRIVVEENKPATQVGKYLYPEALGLSETMGVDYESNSTEKGASERVPPTQPEVRDRTDEQ